MSDIEAPFTPKEIGAVIGAYTGILCGGFSDLHEYIEKILGRPVFTSEMASPDISAQIKDASKEDFLRLANWCKESK